MEVLPPDWGDGYENVAVGCTVEDQRMADYRLPFLLEAPLRHKLIVCAPLLGPIDLAPYLRPGIEMVSAGASRVRTRGHATSTGCSDCAASVSQRMCRSVTTRPVHGWSRTDVFAVFLGPTSTPRPAWQE